jgi:lipopolysaccharide export system permease protein
MVFHASLIREFSRTAVAIGWVLVAVLFTSQIIRLLGMAAGGSLAPEAVLAMLGFGALNYLPIVLSITLFIAILLTLGRAYRDSEMIVWLSSGVSLTTFMRPVLYFALPLAVLVAVLSLYLSPWAVRKSMEYVNRLNARDDVSQVTPGVFIESKRSDRVFFVDALSPEKNTISNVFVQSTQNQRLGVMVAHKGLRETYPNGDRFVVLLNGRRYEGTPGTAEYRFADFERYAVRIEEHEANELQNSPKTLTVAQIRQNPTPENTAEFHWRIGLPVSVVLLSLLAIPLSYVNPRAGRSANLILAGLVYAVYNNVMSIAQAWVVQRKLPQVIGLWPVHGIFLTAFVLLLYRRILVFSPRRLWQRLRLGLAGRP